MATNSHAVGAAEHTCRERTRPAHVQGTSTAWCTSGIGPRRSDGRGLNLTHFGPSMSRCSWNEYKVRFGFSCRRGPGEIMATRRQVIAASLGATLSASIAPSQAQTASKTFVLVHGAWGGGWV